jgi:ABC-type polysaccharide/polyol phosphate export permease
VGDDSQRVESPGVFRNWTLALHRIRELWAYRELVSNLTIRDLRLKYKRSSLGVAWSLLNPLIMMAIYTAVFSVFLRVVNSPHYWALVLGGLLSWLFFANALGSATVAFAQSANLISKVYFPIEALPVASVLANFVNFAISLVVFLVVIVIARLPLGPSLMLLPVILLAQLAFTLGLSLFVATITVYFRDLEHLIGLALTALFYLSPVLYPLNPAALPHGAARFIPWLNLNPMSWFLESYHSVLYYGTWPDPGRFALSILSAVAALLGGYLVFARMRTRLPEEV